MQKAGVSITTEQILQQGLQIQTITGIDGKQHEIAFTYLDPDPSQQGESLEGDYPLMIKEGEWGILTARISEILNGVNIGTQVDSAEQYKLPAYEHIAKDYFSLNYTNGPFFATHMENSDTSAPSFRALANEGNTILTIHPGFFHQDVSEQLKNAITKDEVDNYVDKRVKILLSYVNKIGSTQIKPTYINFINEAVWATNDNRGWENDPIYRVYGKELIFKIYMAFYKNAKEMGLEQGKDFRLIYNDYNLYENSGKSDFAFEILSETKQEIAKELGIPVDQVQLDVGMQMRMRDGYKDRNKSNHGHYPVPSQEEFLLKLQKYARIGRIHITEMSLVNAPNEEERRQIINTLVKTAIESGCVDSIAFEGVLDFRAYEEFGGQTSAAQINLINPDYTPTANYYALLKLLFQLAAKN